MKLHLSGFCFFLVLLTALFVQSGCASVAAPYPVSFLETAKSLRSQGKNVRVKAGVGGVLPTFPHLDVRVAVSDRVEIGAGGYFAIGAGLEGNVTGGKLTLKWQLLDHLAVFLSAGGSVGNYENDIQVLALGADAALLWSHTFGEVFNLFAGLRLGGMASLTATAESVVGTAWIAGVSLQCTKHLEVALEGGILPSLVLRNSGSGTPVNLYYTAVSVNLTF